MYSPNLWSSNCLSPTLWSARISLVIIYCDGVPSFWTLQKIFSCVHLRFSFVLYINAQIKAERRCQSNTSGDPKPAWPVSQHSILQGLLRTATFPDYAASSLIGWGELRRTQSRYWYGSKLFSFVVSIRLQITILAYALPNVLTNSQFFLPITNGLIISASRKQITVIEATPVIPNVEISILSPLHFA